MHLKYIELYPEHKVELPQPCGRIKKNNFKASKAKELGEALQCERDIASEKRVYVAISDFCAHTNHGFGEIEAFSQTVDKDVVLRIHDLVREGITSVSDIDKCLRYYVHDVLFAEKEKPNCSSRAYFPTHADINNHVQAALKKDRFSTIDQENTAVLIERLRTEQPETQVFYRPYAAGGCAEASVVNDNVEEMVAGECEQTLIFCFQTRFMKEMFAKYGASVVCLDATHKTSDYALPLFLLVVKTPVGYTTVGVFIVQFETANCIAEALNIFKEWSPGISPQYFMVDFSQAEISAIREAFPSSHISLCDFHRLQAWNRWLRRKENNVEHPSVVLHLMKQIANSQSEESFERAKDDLNSVHWKNEKLQNYFETVWLPAKELWVAYYRLGFDVVLSTNNGIEAQNKVLKAQHTKSASGKRSLASLISVLVFSYLPQNEKRYHQVTMKQSALYRQWNENVPSYLHGRPHSFVKHMLRRHMNAVEYTLDDIEELGVKCTFAVRSKKNSEEKHTVDFNTPSCTCFDFAKSKYLCKHFCAVFDHIEGWSFLSLPEGCLEGSQVTLQSSDMDPHIEHSDNDVMSAEVLSEPAITQTSVTHAGVSTLRKEIIAQWEKCHSVLHYCDDVEALRSAKSFLESSFSVMAKAVPQSSGLQVRGSPTKGCSSLKPLPKRRRRC
ncbi:uncharacterized protein LOC144141492 [Haemaphysalis longicornis]